MKSFYSKIVLLLGAYFVLLLFLVVNGESALNAGDVGYLYMAALVVYVFVFFPVAALLKIIGIIQKEIPVRLRLLKHKKTTIFLVLLAFVALVPTLRNEYYLYSYDIKSKTSWGGGTETYNVLQRKGEEFCYLSTKYDVNFVDHNDDGYIDIIYGLNERDSKVITYDPKTDEFVGCPFIGG